MNSPTTGSLSDRDLRQRELVPAERLAACHAVVIGVGAVGRQVALQMSALGVPRLTLIDPDDVRVEKLASQGYWVEDLGSSKVHSTTAVCRRINPDVQVTPVAQRFQRSAARNLAGEALVVFACVDRIATRLLLWKALHSQAAFFVDGRMSGEVIRVLAVASPTTDSSYATTLFAPERAYAGSCTARSTIYAAGIAAGLMVGQLTRWLRRLPVDPDLSLNLLAAELTALPPTPS